MTDYSRVRYATEGRPWEEVRKSNEPVFLAPIGVRALWPTLSGELLRCPGLALRARRAGIESGTLGRFLSWRETARCFGVRSLISEDDETELFGRYLPAPEHVELPPRSGITGLVIARNEEATLRAALQSLAGLADELVVVDDESTDGTAQVAEGLGARVLTRPLGGDFAAQRNAGLSMVHTEWVMTIDADEVIEPELIPVLERAARWPRSDAVFVPRFTVIAEQGEAPVFWPDLQLKLFRSGFRYRGVVHEQLEGWRHPIFTALSGPYIMHRKDIAREERAELLYDAIYAGRVSRESSGTSGGEDPKSRD